MRSESFFSVERGLQNRNRWCNITNKKNNISKMYSRMDFLLKGGIVYGETEHHLASVRYV